MGSGKISFEDVRIIKRDVNEYYIGGGEDKIILGTKTVRVFSKTLMHSPRIYENLGYQTFSSLVFSSVSFF